MEIFRDDQDYKNFLKRIALALGKEVAKGASFRSSLHLKPFNAGTFSLISLCLMPNHFHLEIMQNTDIPIGKLLLKTCTSYSMYFNRKYDHVGHIFQDQFKAVPIENDRQLTTVSAYIHQNPKVAGLVDDSIDWPYSSYRSYLGSETINLYEKELILEQFKDVDEYKMFVEDRYEEIKERGEILHLMLD